MGEVIDRLAIFSELKVASPRFVHSEIENFQSEVLEKAVGQARVKAFAMAEKEGRTLGKALRIQEGRDSGGSYGAEARGFRMAKESSADAASGAPTKINPKKINVRQDVTVRYLLK